MTTYPVTLYVYDISQGMAKVMSPMIVGRQVDGIWHTSIVVHDNEYYFQGGTFGDKPKSTPFGMPVKEIALGSTELTKQELDDYVLSVQDQFSEQTYDIFKNNCNHYSNNLAELLTGDQIPSEYLNQAKEFENTQIGAFIKQMNEAMKSQVRSQHQGQVQYGQTSVANTAVHSSDVKVISTAEEYLLFISGNERAVVDFGADWCGPCRNIKPAYEALARQYKGKIAFAAVNIDKAREVAESVGVRSVPMFLFFKSEKEFDRLLGANEAKLRSILSNLTQ